MGFFNKLAQYKEFRHGVSHCTFNPDGPGVVRIHLIPPKFKLFSSDSYIVILNGYYLLPISNAWALILSYFIKEVNHFHAKPISAENEAEIVNNTVQKIHKLYPAVSPDTVREDLLEILDVLFAVATGEGQDLDIEKLSIRAYAKHMIAPHRMDLMVSAMTDENGLWKCNQKCRFCYAAGQCRSNARELSTEEWMQVIDRLTAAHVPMITFTGGEPTLRSDIADLVRHANFSVTRLNTNGVLLTKSLCDELRKASLDSVQITLYSHDSAIHNTLVGTAHFSDTVNGIRNAVASGLDVSVNTPLCRDNRDYLKTLAFLDSLGVRFVTVSGLICTGMADKTHSESDLTANELLCILKEAKAYCDKVGMEIDFTSPGLVPKNELEALGMNVPMCGAALSNMAIAPDGEVIPCQSWLSTDAGLGNILKTPFKKIWNHKKAIKLRSMKEDQALACPFRDDKKEGLS